MKIVTFNLRSRYTGDGINSFVNRAVSIFDKIREETPDVIAFQEVKAPHLEILELLLKDYALVGLLRDKNYSGEGSYAAVKKDTCQLLGFETIWLSPTPYVAGSRFEHQSSHARICQQVQIRHHKTGKVLRLFNLHLDHMSEEARISQMQVALSFVKEYEAKGGHPYILLGDFNAKPDSAAVAMCPEAGLTEVTHSVPVTFHGFGKTKCKLDYIFVSEELAGKVKNVRAWENEENGIYLSDHYPIAAEITLSND